MKNKIRELLNSNSMTLCTRLANKWPYLVEMVGAFGNFDYVEYVAEYSPFSQDELENFVRAAELHNLGTMIKVDYYNSAYVAQKAIASGFQAILFTDCHSAEDVRKAVYSVKPDTPEHRGHFGYPTRRFIHFQPFLKQQDHVERVNDVVLAFMIEKQSAMDEIEEICSIPGVDMVQFGPSDFAMSNGKNLADYRPQAQEAEKRMIEIALKHNVRPRCEIYGKPGDIKDKLNLGVRDICFGDDIKTYRHFAEQIGKEARDILLSNK